MKIRKELDGCYRIVDLGCGQASYISILRESHYTVGVDGYQPHLDESKAKGIHDEYILSDLMAIDFPKKSFDAVMCCQVIEHLTKEDARILLDRMNQWASRKIFITVPNSPHGFGACDEAELHSPGFDRYRDVPTMNHMSGWTPRDLEALGYRVRGYQGLERFVNKKGFLQKVFFYITFPLSYYLPQYAHQLLAVKDVS